MKGSHNSNIDLNFYNDRIKEVMDKDTMLEPFTYVPIKAGHMEVVGGNAIVFGKITEGYDVINPSVDVDITYEDVSSSVQRVDLGVTYFQVGVPVMTYYNKGDDGLPDPTPVDVDIWDGTQSWRTIYGVIIITIPTKIYAGQTYYVSVHVEKNHLGPLVVSYTAGVGDTNEDVRMELRQALIDGGVDAADVWLATPPGLLYIFPDSHAFSDEPHPEVGGVEDIYIPDYIISAYVLIDDPMKFQILKCGAVHGFGIVYKDRSGRQCSVMKTDDMTVYIPFYAEVTANDLTDVAKLVFKIYHTPPTWAETYEIVYFGNLSMDLYSQMRATKISAIAGSPERYAMDFNGTIEATQLKNYRWRVPTWTWAAGDRVRLIGTVDDLTGVVTKYTTLYDYEIEETGDEAGTTIGGDWFIFQAIEHPALFATQTNILVEIYRPRKGLDRSTELGGIGVAYGVGMVFDIGTDANGNLYHKGDVDQILNVAGATTTAAEVHNTKIELVNGTNVYTIRAHDGWKFMRLNYNTLLTAVWPFWAEGYFPSDWWDAQTVSNKLTSNGFPFLDDLSLRQTELHERYRFGGFLITGTRTNNIAHFVFDDFKDLSKKYGDITGMREVGYTLKILQLHKETSIYINRVQTFSADGGEADFSLSSKLLNTERPMEDDFGCQHPNSVMVNGRNMYYWDNNEGAFIRSSPNGQHILSGPEYKMQRWFKDLLEWIRTSGGASELQVNIGANNDHEEIWATWNMNDVIYGVIFSEKQGRFVSRINQITESYLHLGNFFAHLYHQRLWIMNIDEGQKWLYWSGLPVYAEVEVVSNVESGKNKVFNAIAQFADHLLQSLARFIRIPAEASGTYELMETNAPIYEIREGIYFGEIMKDEHSKGNFVDVYDKKLNGREMRGRYCYVRHRTEEHDEKVRIDSIAIFSTPSERNI